MISGIPSASIKKLENNKNAIENTVESSSLANILGTTQVPIEEILFIT